MNIQVFYAMTNEPMWFGSDIFINISQSIITLYSNIPGPL